MQLTGMPPSAESMCSLYPIQETWCPLALRLLPTLQACDNSASIPAIGIDRWRSRRLGSLGRSSPLRGRPRLRFGFGVSGSLGAGFSRASIAVASREMCPTR